MNEMETIINLDAEEVTTAIPEVVTTIDTEGLPVWAKVVIGIATTAAVAGAGYIIAKRRKAKKEIVIDQEFEVITTDQEKTEETKDSDIT